MQDSDLVILELVDLAVGDRPFAGAILEHLYKIVLIVLGRETGDSDLTRMFSLSEFLHFLHALTFVSFTFVRQLSC